MINTHRRIADPYEKLFLEEEFKSEAFINTIRLFTIFILGFLVLVQTDITGGKMPMSFKITSLNIGIALIYSISLLFLYRRKIYHPFIKYISSTIDVTLIIISIFAYKFDDPEKYANIYFLARFSLIYVFIILSIIRYHFWLSFYTGLVAVVEYVGLVVLNNHMNGFEFSFLGMDGLTHVSTFELSEIYLKIFYLTIGGFMAGLVAVKVRSIVTNSLKQENEKSQLELKNKVIEVVNTENKKYLDNISDGLLLIDKDYVINNQYSKHLADIFETDIIGGKSFINLIYPDKKTQLKERKELSEFLSLLYSNTASEISMIMDVNPIVNKTIKIKDNNGTIKEKIINSTFHRIIENDEIENVMIIIKDVTELVRAQKSLETEKIRHEAEIEVISVILKTDREILREFLEESDTMLNKVEINIDKLEDNSILNETFRDMHSLKGSARSIGFITISNLAHEIEDSLSMVRDSKIKPDFELKSNIKLRINEIFTNIGIIKEIRDKFKNFTSLETISTGKQLDGFIDSIKQMTNDIAKQLDKNIELRVKTNMEIFPLLTKQVKDSIIHLIRNAADHGIEDKFERLTAEKPERAYITLQILKKEDKYIVSVQDDGKGIDFDLIKKKAIERNIINDDSEPVSKSKLLSVLFMPAFSSKGEITDISGRGVGPGHS